MASGIKQFTVQNFLGGINTIAEDTNLAFFGADVKAEVRDAQNLVPNNRGGLSQVKGFSVFKATGSSKITGLGRYIKADGTSLFMVATGGKVYKLVSGTLTDIGITISSSNWTHFETAADKLIICDGTNTIKAWDGTTVTTITDGSPSPTVGSVQSLWYQNRLWTFGNPANPGLVYFSNANDITTGYFSQFVQCDYNDGQKITGIQKYFIPGQIEPYILVAKERSMGIIRGDGSTSNPYFYTRINQEVGAASFRQMAQFGNDVAFFSQKGVSSYTVNNQYGNLQYAYLSEKIRNQFTSLPMSTMKDAMVWHDANNRRVSIAVTENGFTHPNVIWHFDTLYQCWFKERWNTGQDITASFVDIDGTWYHGDSLGNIMVHDASGAFNGGLISWLMKTPQLDFGVNVGKKQIQEQAVTVRGNGSFQVSVSNAFDFNERTGPSNTIALNSTGRLWGDERTWGDGWVWGGSRLKTKRFYPSGYFRQIEQTFFSSGINQQVDLFDLNYSVVYTSQT